VSGGSTENAAVCIPLLQDLLARGLADQVGLPVSTQRLAQARAPQPLPVIHGAEAPLLPWRRPEPLCSQARQHERHKADRP
jgi:hypothetical protein